MINHLQNEYARLTRRLDEIGALGADPRPLVQDHIRRLEADLNTLADRIKTCRELQRQFLTVLQIVRGIDFYIQPTKKGEFGDEQTSPEVLAIKKLAAFTGKEKVRRVRDNGIILLSHLDSRYSGFPEKKNVLYFFSSAPRPGVYALPLSGIGIAVSLDPVYISCTQEADKK